MTSRKSVASILIFIGSLLCFSLPFVTVSCGDRVTLTGKEMVGGTVIQRHRIGGDPWAAVAVTAALIGLGLSLAGRSMAKGTAGAGAAGAVSLILMKGNIETQVRQQTNNMGTVTMENGFYLTVAILIIGAVWNGIMVANHEDY